jgi:diguanylate cyclase (GGDEF)-like protein
MPDIQSPWQAALAFGFAILTSSCFIHFSRTLAWRPAADRLGQLLIDAIVVAIALAGATLIAGLALSTPATIAEHRELALFLIVPVIGCVGLALHLSAATAGAMPRIASAGLLAVSALLTPVAGALTSAAGRAWIDAPGGLASAGLLAFVCLLSALGLLARDPPSTARQAGAGLLLAIGWLLPQVLGLAHWPAAAGSATPATADGLALLIGVDTLVVVGLFLLSRRLLGGGAPARGANGTPLTDAERHCQQLLTSANVGYFDWQLPAATVSYGGAWARLLGYAETDSEPLRQTSRPLLGLCHPHDQRLAQRLLDELAAGQRPRGRCEVRLRTVDERWHWALVNARAVEWQADGRPSRVVGTLLDNDRVKRLEHLLRSERGLFAAGPVIVLSFDAAPPYRLRQASANLPAALGRPARRRPADLALATLVHADDAARLADTVRRAVGRPGAQAQCELRLAGSSGACSWHLLHVVAERPNGGQLLRAYLVDINPLKEAESHAAEHTTTLHGVVHKMSETQHFMETLQQLTELLQLCESEAESEQIIVQGGPQLFPGWSGALTFAGDGGLMTVAARWGEPFTAHHAMEADCWAVRRGRLHQASAEPAVQVLSPVCAHFGGGARLPPGITYTICAPLLKSFDRPGVLHLVAHETLDEEQLRAAAWGAETFADALKLSLGNLRLRSSLREQAVHDEMTELYNRRYFDEALKRELSRAQRTGDRLILAILDIDHFKKFNDTYGHEAGDEVLRNVAEYLRRFVRAYDIACRIGGEELAIIMARVGLDEACARLDQLRQEIGHGVLVHSGTQLPAVTVSIGVAELDAEAPDDLLHRADTALYAAKNGGRNRVMCWSTTLAADAPEPPVAAAAGASPSAAQRPAANGSGLPR